MRRIGGGGGSESSLATFPVGVLYVSSSASEPNHCTLTTVTRPSDRMPRTAALAWRSSSFMRCS